MNPGRSITALIERRSAGMPVDDRRQRVGRDRQLRGMGVDFDLRAHDLRFQRERPSDDRDDDRQAERRAVIAAGQVDRRGGLPGLGDEQRVGARSGADNRVPDLRRGGARPLRACGSPQSGTFEIIPNRPSGVLNCSFRRAAAHHHAATTARSRCSHPPGRSSHPPSSSALNGNGDAHALPVGAGRDLEAAGFERRLR